MPGAGVGCSAIMPLPPASIGQYPFMAGSAIPLHPLTRLRSDVERRAPFADPAERI